MDCEDAAKGIAKQLRFTPNPANVIDAVPNGAHVVFKHPETGHIYDLVAKDYLKYVDDAVLKEHPYLVNAAVAGVFDPSLYNVFINSIERFLLSGL